MALALLQQRRQAALATLARPGRPAASPRPVPARFVAAGATGKRPGDQPQQQPMEESDFDKETANLALRMLTARATSMVLQNVSEVDTFKASWLQDYVAKHPPLEGNAFLAELMQTKPVYSVDPYSGATHYVNPAAIAGAVLATREALAQKLSKSIAPRVAEANMHVMRTHLEMHTYVSGSNEATKPSFRQYRTRRGAQQRQQAGMQ